MIFTLGKTDIYEPYLETDPKAAKGIGGSVWRHYDDVIVYLDETRHSQDISQYTIYGVLANWETDTKIVEGESWRALTKNSKLVKLM